MTCPYIVTGNGGTSYCRLAEDAAIERDRLKALNDKLMAALEEIRDYDGYGDRAEDHAHCQNLAYDALAKAGAA